MLEIKLMQRPDGSKRVTEVHGIKDHLLAQAILSSFKTSFNCNGSIRSEKASIIVLQVSGDRREQVASYLKEMYSVKEDEIKII